MHPGGAPAARDPSTSPARLRALWDESPALAPLLAENPSAPPDLLRVLSGHADPAVRRAVAGNPNTPREVLLVLAPDFPAPLARNPALRLLWLEDPGFLVQLPKELLCALLDGDANPPWLPRAWTEAAAEHSDLVVLAHLAASRLAAPRALARLAARAPRLHAEIAKNPSAPPALLRVLAASPASPVRAAVAGHPKARAALLSSLLEDESSEVRRAAAQHPQAPKKLYWLLRAAGADPSLSEVEGGRREPLSPQALRGLARGGVFARCLAAQHPQVSGPVLRLLLADKHPAVRGAALRSPRVTLPLVSGLSQDPSPAVRAAVARHPRCPVDALERLSRDPDPTVCLYAAQSLRLPLASLCAFLERQSAALPASEAGEALSADPGRVLRAQAVALLPRALAGLLGRSLAGLADWEESLAGRPWLAGLCAESPEAPGALLAEFARDGRHARALVANPGTPDEVRAALLQRDPALGSPAMWSAPSLGPASLAVLAGGANLEARKTAARSPKTRAVDLFSLSGDAAVQVRRAVAKNWAAPPPLLERLARDEDPGVRVLVAQHPNTPPETLRALLDDESPEVRRAAYKNPSAPGRLL